MTTFAILASGPSMSQAVADSVRDRCGVIAVSDSYRLAPWADALVAQDKAWWKFHAGALAFAGRKFSGAKVDGVEFVSPSGIVVSGTNSGLLGCHIAVTAYGATRLLLLGLDLQGTHFFGPHPAPLKNTRPDRFDAMCRQFKQWSHKGVTVFNCTPNSRLTCFPMADLDDCLAESSRVAA